MLYRQIQQNKRKTWVLIVLFCLIVLAIGAATGYLLLGDYLGGMVLAAVILAIYVPITYTTSASQVLRMSGARPITKEDHPMLFNIVEELTIPARVPMPKIYIVDDPAPNAFATGIKPEKGAVAFTTGLLEQLDREELEAVAAHELAHIRNYDIRLMTVCIALVGVVAILADLGSRMLYIRGGRGGANRRTNPAIMIIALVFVILSPLIAQFVQLAVSRNREYLADATAVEFTRNPVGLKNALLKISGNPLKVKNAKTVTASMYIVNPFGRIRRNWKGWFATHPPIEKRIERLERM